MKRWMKFGCFLIAAVLTVSLTGCQTRERPNETQPETQAGTAQKSPAELAQIRLSHQDQGWEERFRQENGVFLVAQDRQQLLDQLTQRSIDPTQLELSEYDDAFFDDWLLVVIPRTSNTGSIRFGSEIKVENGTLALTLTGKVDGMGTADRADWLIFVPIQKADAQDLTIVVPQPSEHTPYESI